MAESTSIWEESEWERYANELLSTHYAMNSGCYQRIPATCGDCGLEGVTDCGCAYQHYADQNSKNHDERTRKQKKKIREDLKKLETYKVFWCEFLGDKKLRRWTLMVPNLDDKEVVKYAKKKARELLKKELPFLATDFEAFVKTSDDYSAAKLIARDPRLPKATLTKISAESISEFKKKEAHFVKNIDDKLAKVPANASNSRLDFREKLLVYHLLSANYLEELRNDFPPQWEELDELINALAESISTEEHVDSRPAKKRLMEIRKDLEHRLSEGHKFIRENERLNVSWGTVSKWLGECPLDFSGADND